MNVELIQDLFYNSSYTLPTLLDRLNGYFTLNINEVYTNNRHLIDSDLLEEIKESFYNRNINIYLGNMLKDIKCVIQDENGRKHEIFIYSKGPKNLCVTGAKMPCSHLMQCNYASLGDIIQTFTKHVNDLSCYFYQLEQIDNLCAVMEPKNRTFEADYRRIYLDDRTWLHLEVTPDGLATNIHLIGHTEEWHNKLQAGLLRWDHDKDIVENILNVFGLTSFSFPLRESHCKVIDDESGPSCSICLCIELPNFQKNGLPQPLCKNYACGVFYHRTCLFEWLCISSGNHQPAFGVVSGACPCCFQLVESNIRFY